jgi:hypothetical protein
VVVSRASCFGFVETFAMNDFDLFEPRFADALRSDADRNLARFEAGSIARAAISSTPRRAMFTLPRIALTGRPSRLAAAAIIAVLAVGGALYLVERGQHSGVGSPVQTPAASPSPTGSGRSIVSPGIRAWNATQSMGSQRSGHSATLLPVGKVLVAGGNFSSDAELYDPGNGSWTATGRMSVGRTHHTATLLSGGKVLVAGGVNIVNGVASAVASASAELYDPGTGSWTATGSMAVARTDHTATLLPDGKVLVAGGFGVKSAELYDPNTGTWTNAGAMTHDRAKHTATLLLDGTVLVVGGFSGHGNLIATSSAELYDPATGIWSATGAMARGRAGQIAVLLPDGHVLVAGGSTAGDSFHSTASADLYDPATRSWTATGSMNSALVYAAATLLPDGTVLVAGGYSGTDNFPPVGPAAAGLYHPDTGTWTATPEMTAARTSPTATLLRDGSVLVTGGRTRPALGTAFDTAEIYQ